MAAFRPRRRSPASAPEVGKGRVDLRTYRAASIRRSRRSSSTKAIGESASPCVFIDHGSFAARRGPNRVRLAVPWATTTSPLIAAVPQPANSWRRPLRPASTDSGGASAKTIGTVCSSRPSTRGRAGRRRGRIYWPRARLLTPTSSKSVSGAGRSPRRPSSRHHNVGGLPERQWRLKLIEPAARSCSRTKCGRLGSRTRPAGSVHRRPPSISRTRARHPRCPAR